MISEEVKKQELEGSDQSQLQTRAGGHLETCFAGLWQNNFVVGAGAETDSTAKQALNCLCNFLPFPCSFFYLVQSSDSKQLQLYKQISTTDYILAKER